MAAFDCPPLLLFYCPGDISPWNEADARKEIRRRFWHIEGMRIALLSLLAAGVVMAQALPLPMKVSMIALGVKDPARSIKFYSEALECS
jgi:hypothetical protein